MGFFILLQFIVLSYLIGSIPFGLILTKLAGLGDIRAIGSGNIGATNVLRTGNKTLAILTLLLDLSKGLGVVFLARFLIPAPTLPFDLALGMITILGHCFPVWLKFKGGKGVSTSLGVLLAATPVTGGLTLVTWIIVFALTRISSLSALSAAFIAPLATFLVYGPLPALLTALITVLVFARHRDNIQRLLKGQEKRMGGKKDAANLDVQH